MPVTTTSTTISPLSPEEEDQIVLARITNDERPLRRVIKKFHSYTSVAGKPVVPPAPPSGAGSATTVEDAREAFLVELASFQLLLKKSAMICEAEARQVEEYQKEKQKIDDEHGALRGQIEQLKTSLEHEQMVRRRKMEYDLVAEKVNTLPSRDELQKSIEALENDLAAIRVEHDTQTRTIQGHKAALDGIIVDLGSLRFGGGSDPTVSLVGSSRGTPALDSIVSDVPDDSMQQVPSRMGTGTPLPFNVEEKEEGEEGEEEKALDSAANADIEMGEVEEESKSSRLKKAREDLEEGEATDASSELSEPPDDI